MASKISWEFFPGQIDVGIDVELGIDENYGLLRAKVPGGWLVATVQGGPEDVIESHHYIPRGICFLPDSNHSWNPEAEAR
jgi:hypothetical protein